jgi:transcriptional regulator with XRE-family HTH domain
MRKGSTGAISRRTTASQRVALAHVAYLARRIGTALKDARLGLHLRQRDAAGRAGITQAHWSRIERGLEHGASLSTLASCAVAVEARLAAFVEEQSGADLPRDIEHLRRQHAIVELAQRGGWEARPEAPLPGNGPRPRSIDVLLVRRSRREAAVVEVWDLFLDVGDAMRGLDAKVLGVRDRLGPEWHVGGLLVVRATRRNRRLVSELRSLFAAHFPGSSARWLRALGSPETAMPSDAGFAWTATDAGRLFAARLGSGEEAG